MVSSLVFGKELCAALLRLLGKSAKVNVQGKEVKISELMDSLDSVAARAVEKAAAKAAYHATVDAHRALVDDVTRVVVALAATVRATRSRRELVDLGLAPKTRRG
jgi:hypothetical protein